MVFNASYNDSVTVTPAHMRPAPEAHGRVRIPPGGMVQTTRMSTPWSRSQAAARRARSRLT